MFRGLMVAAPAGRTNLGALPNARNGNAPTRGAVLAKHRQGGQRERRPASRWNSSVVLRRLPEGGLLAGLLREERTVDAAPRDQSDRYARLHAAPFCKRSTRSRADVNRWNRGATGPAPLDVDASTEPLGEQGTKTLDVLQIRLAQ